MASVNMGDVKVTKVELFFANWCGHCIKFKPEWATLKKMLDDKGIKWNEYEADKDANKMEEENIRGYPTIRITVGGNKQEYNGERSAKAIFNVIMNPNKILIQEAGKMNQCGGVRHGFTPRIRNNNRNNHNIKDDEYYKIKYMKYKAKYMKKLYEMDM